MSEYVISKTGIHKIESNYTLCCAETGRVVAVFYNDYDIDEFIGNCAKPSKSRDEFVREAIEKIQSCEIVRGGGKRIRLREALGAILELGE